MKIRNAVVPFLLSPVFFLFSCSGSGGGKTTGKLPTVTTSTPTDLTSSTATLGGNVTSTGGKSISAVGVYVGKTENPTSGTADFQFSSGYIDSGAFQVPANNLQSGVTYHARAFAVNETGTGYGNDITFTLNAPAAAKTLNPTNIIANSVTLKGTATVQTGVSTVHRGFVFSTSHNPDVQNSLGVTDNFSGSGDYSVDLQIVPYTLQPNTVYYVRAYVETINTSGYSDYYYGEEVSFKTTGYYGPSGGYVVYDKGETTNGWRYLEAAPSYVQYSGYSPYWGCSGTSITQTYPDLGTGQANTSKIVSVCGASNCAARWCDDYTVNGYSDWFLPSSAEAIYMMRSLYALQAISKPFTCWTSSELNSSNASSAYIDYSGTFSVPSAYKTDVYATWPIRKY